MKLLMVKDRNVIATKFLAEFANNMAEQGHRVEIACHARHENSRGALLNPAVALDNFYAAGERLSTRLLSLFKQLLVWPPLLYKLKISRSRPDVVVCYFLIDLFNVMLLGTGAAKVVMMVHNCPEAVFERIDKKNWLARKIYRRLLAKVDVVQVLQPSFVQPFVEHYRPPRVVAIANAIAQHADGEIAAMHSEQRAEGGTVVYVGRVAKKGKRQHLLIEAFAKVADRHPGWTLEFWGLLKHGQYLQQLEQRIAALGLTDRVFICGYTDDIQAVYRRADINAFPSLREGFGLGLADGMAMGLPSIGYASAPSVNELIEHGVNGFLADDDQQFADYLGQLMADRPLRQQFGLAARKRVEPYAQAAVMQQWQTLLEELSAC